MITAEFLLTSLIIVLLPGTGVIYTVSAGLFQGWRASTIAAIGCTMANIPHMSISILGLSAILQMNAYVLHFIKLAGALYLIYLAWEMWNSSGSLEFIQPSSRRGYWKTLSRGFIINILNPKLTLFFLAYLPLFVTPGASSPTNQMVVLSITFMAMTVGIFILYGFLANGVRHYVVNSPRVITFLQRVFAATFVVLSAKLACT